MFFHAFQTVVLTFLTLGKSNCEAIASLFGDVPDLPKLVMETGTSCNIVNLQIGKPLRNKKMSHITILFDQFFRQLFVPVEVSLGLAILHFKDPSGKFS